MKLKNEKGIFVVLPSDDSVVDPKVCIDNSVLFDDIIILDDNHWFSNREQLFASLVKVI